jgi:hypothetical protein
MNILGNGSFRFWAMLPSKGMPINIAKFKRDGLSSKNDFPENECQL